MPSPPAFDSVWIKMKLPAGAARSVGLSRGLENGRTHELTVFETRARVVVQGPGEGRELVVYLDLADGFARHFEVLKHKVGI